jgi:hypothetical protein
MTKVLRLNAGQVEEVDVTATTGTLITTLGTIAAAGLASGDLFLVIDVSDTSGDAGGTAKIITKAELAIAMGGASWTETEIDFGSAPVWSRTFTISDAAVGATSNIIAVASSEPATGRAAGDAEWDGLVLAARATGTGTMEITAIAAPGPVSGKRKVLYQVA